MQYNAGMKKQQTAVNASQASADGYSAESAEFFMRAALDMAARAARRDEVPVGAVVVLNGKIIARAHNKTRTAKSSTAHAEMLALRRAARKIGGWRMCGADVFVTLEPCAMCAGALALARVRCVYFGASDESYGACGTNEKLNIPENFHPNHALKAAGGILADDCSKLLKEYFKGKRKKQ